ncbi:hypothetical protein [Streptomyces sp. NPDC003006]
MVEPLADRTRDLYASAEERLLRIIAPHLAVQQLRRAVQGVVEKMARRVSSNDGTDTVPRRPSDGSWGRDIVESCYLRFL